MSEWNDSKIRREACDPHWEMALKGHTVCSRSLCSVSPQSLPSQFTLASCYNPVPPSCPPLVLTWWNAPCQVNIPRPQKNEILELKSQRNEQSEPHLQLRKAKPRSVQRSGDSQGRTVHLIFGRHLTCLNHSLHWSSH